VTALRVGRDGARPSIVAKFYSQSARRFFCFDLPLELRDKKRAEQKEFELCPTLFANRALIANTPIA
jgi:hypothetical protein